MSAAAGNVEVDDTSPSPSSSSPEHLTHRNLVALLRPIHPVQSEQPKSTSPPSPSPSPVSVSVSVPTRKREASLDDLPDDVVLRIITMAGNDSVARQLAVAYRLGSANARIHALVRSEYLCKVHSFTPVLLSLLNLSHTARARAALHSFFTHATSLRSVDLSGCPCGLLSGGLLRCFPPTLRTLNLSYCSVSDAVLAPALRRCTALETLVLVSVKGLTGEGFRASCVRAPIKRLDLDYVTSLTFAGLRALSTLSSLQQLSVRGCETVTSSSLPDLLGLDNIHIYKSHARFTNFVDAAKYDSDEEESAANYGAMRATLQSINLSYTAVGDAALYKMLRATPALTTIILAENTCNLWATGDFTSHGIRTLMHCFPRLKIFFKT